MHYLLKCGFFDNERRELLKPLYYRRTNMIKFKDLLTCNNEIVLAKIVQVLQIIMNKFSNETTLLLYFQQTRCLEISANATFV